MRLMLHRLLLLILILVENLVSEISILIFN